MRLVRACTPQPTNAATALSGRARYLRRDAGAGAGAHGGDPGAVHHRERHAGLRVVEHEEAGDVRQALGGVGRVAGDPLEAGHLGLPHVGRHGVDEAVRARVDAGLGRHLGLAAALGGEPGVERVDDLAHGHAETLDVRPAQVDEFHESAPVRLDEPGRSAAGRRLCRPPPRRVPADDGLTCPPRRTRRPARPRPASARRLSGSGVWLAMMSSSFSCAFSWPSWSRRPPSSSACRG